MLRKFLVCALPIGVLACATSPPREIALEIRNVPSEGAQVLIQETFPGFLQPRAQYTRLLEMPAGDNQVVLKVCPPIRVRIVGYWSTLHLAKPIDWNAARPTVVVDVNALSEVPSLERDRELVERDKEQILQRGNDAGENTRCVEP